MSIELKEVIYDSNNNFIILSSPSKVSIDFMQQALKKMLEISKIENCNKILIDATKALKMPATFELFTFGVFMSTKILKLVKMSFACTISDEISNDVRFFETVLANRATAINIFKNVNDAKEWLLNE